MKIATKKALDNTIGKQWEYQTETFLFNSWEEVDDNILIATDKRTITVEPDMLDMFLAGLIEVGAKKNGHSENGVEPYQPIGLSTVSEQTQTTVVDGLLKTFDELSQAQSPEKIRAISLKASNQVKLVGALTGMARLEIEMHKMSSGKKSNKN